MNIIFRITKWFIGGTYILSYTLLVWDEDKGRYSHLSDIGASPNTINPLDKIQCKQYERLVNVSDKISYLLYKSLFII